MRHALEETIDGECVGTLDGSPSEIRFSAAYKRRILGEADRTPDGVRAILDREGLYFADILRWREQEARGCINDSCPLSAVDFDDEESTIEAFVLDRLCSA